MFLTLFFLSSSDKVLLEKGKVLSQEQKAAIGLGRRRHFMRTLFLIASANQRMTLVSI
jgi:hypothetical protein